MNGSVEDDRKYRALAAVAAAWKEGCPVAGPPHEKVAEVCIRRLRSYERRGVGPSREQRIRDLAKGLIAAFEADPSLVGPLRIDYEYLAGRVHDAIES
jgi:hypothetical protein